MAEVTMDILYGYEANSNILLESLVKLSFFLFRLWLN